VGKKCKVLIEPQSGEALQLDEVYVIGESTSVDAVGGKTITITLKIPLVIPKITPDQLNEILRYHA
jgi:hypothetical protein